MELRSSALADVPALWGAPGLAGYFGQSWAEATPPWCLAGLARGAWSLEDSRRGRVGFPDPGTPGVSTMLPSVDSVEFRLLDGAAFQGYGATLGSAVRIPTVNHERTIRSTVMISGGSQALDDNAIEVTRADSASWLEIESLGGKRGISGSLGRSGRHEWGIGVGRAFRRHRLEGSFTHRAVAASLLLGEEQSGRNESGRAGWSWTGTSTRARLGYERGYGHHESFGGLLLESSRAASATRLDTDLEWNMGLGRILARGDWTTARVNRTGEGEFETDGNWGWGALSFVRGVGPGQVELTAGAGRHSVTRDVNFAPSAGYRVAGDRWSGRVAYERMVLPIWSDLQFGEDPFVQSTDAGTIEIRHHREGFDAHVAVVSGRTENRALVSRQPFEELWLREGYERQIEPYTFTLATADGRVMASPFLIVGSGFVLRRTRSAQQPNVDPGWGSRAEARYHRRFFRGDLGTTFTAGVDVLGKRESEGLTPLPVIVTSRASVALTLLDAFVILDFRNLENRAHEEVWVDPLTGLEALTAGLEWRLSFNLRLRN